MNRDTLRQEIEDRARDAWVLLRASLEGDKAAERAVLDAYRGRPYALVQTLVSLACGMAGGMAEVTGTTPLAYVTATQAVLNRAISAGAVDGMLDAHDGGER